jgi:all-trans-retinol dehydrogenase (NAD+)
MSDYAGRKVLVTGAASGLGRLMALAIAAEGGELILWDVNRAGADAVRGEIARTGRPASCYPCDLADRHAIAATARQTLADHGGIDILINNAGVVSGKGLLEISEEAIQRTFDVNTLALFWTTRAFLPGMIARDRGHVVTVASAAGIVGTSRLVDYCASKHAAVGFNESLRLELRRQRSHVRTTVVCPFYISTGMFAGVKTRFPLLLPIMDPEYVVTRIVKAVQRNRARVVLPRLIYATFLARLLPVPLFDASMEFLGVNKSMDEFTGRAGEKDQLQRRQA